MNNQPQKVLFSLRNLLLLQTFFFLLWSRKLIQLFANR